MKDYIDKFLRYMRIERNASEHTLRAYERDLLEFARFSGENINKIDLIDIRGFVAEQTRRGLKKTTASRKLATIRAFFKYLHREGIIKANPARLVPSPKLPKRLPNFLSIDDVLQLIDKTKGIGFYLIRDKAILELFYSSGLRVSELTSLNMEDLNTKQRIIKVKGKGSKERLLPIGSHAMEAIKAYLVERLLIKRKRKHREGNALFLNKFADRITERSVRRIVVKFGRAIGIEGSIGPHTLRHTFATHLLHEGADLRVIQELLGHSSLSTTQKYTHLDIKQLMNVYDKSHPLANLEDRNVKK